MFQNSEHFPRDVCSDSLLTCDVNADLAHHTHLDTLNSFTVSVSKKST